MMSVPAAGRASVPARPRDAYAQRLARTTTGVFRALASPPGRLLAADPARLDQAGWQMLLAEVPRRSHPQWLARWRGRVDALAVRTRYSDARSYGRDRPASKVAQRLFWLLEQNRVEILGARSFPGVRLNLEALAQEQWLRARPEGVVRAAADAWIETFALLARVPLGAPLPPVARLSLSAGWRQWMSADQAAQLQGLAGLVDDQAAFARQALRVVAAVLGPQTGADAARQAQPDPRGAAQERPQRAPPAAESATPREEAHAGGDPIAWPQQRESEGAAVASQAPRAHAPYRIFTSAFDQTAEAATLCDAATLARRRHELDERVGAQLTGVMRWAHRLQRRLLALQMRTWRFDQEEGLLDAGRLSRVVTHPLEPLAYKQESEIEFPDTVVSLLVDNSGSMRGRPIATAAVCAELLGRVLEHCGVKSEVLGFTTCSWNGGRARAQWISAGRPDAPGRLTELRHIIYKTADQPWRRARACLGLMLEDGLLKENVDGEALLWAHGRLMRRPEPRRILLVISDGAPMDDATLEANDAGYLDRHLRTVIERIEQDGSVELAAIGIGHDVTGYYRRAVRVGDAEDLGEAIVAQLIDLFDLRTRP